LATLTSISPEVLLRSRESESKKNQVREWETYRFFLYHCYCHLLA